MAEPASQGHPGVSCACPSCPCLPCPVTQPGPAPGVPPRPAGTDGPTDTLEQPFLACFSLHFPPTSPTRVGWSALDSCQDEMGHRGWVGCPWGTWSSRDPWDAAPAPPVLPVGAQQVLRCCWRLLGSVFSELPASHSLEEDLPLSQGVTASRDLSNLYLHCNLYLSCSVYSC